MVIRLKDYHRWESAVPIIDGFYWYYGYLFDDDQPQMRPVKVCVIPYDGKPLYYVFGLLIQPEAFEGGLWVPLMTPQEPEAYFNFLNGYDDDDQP